MRRGGAGLIAAVLALAGCKSTSDPKPPDRPTAGLAGRPKDKAKDKEQGPTWLEPVSKLPGSGTAVPTKGTWGGDPKNPNFDAKTEAQDAVGGKVVDASGRPAKNVFIRVEGVNDPPGTAPKGIYADDSGYFFTRGLKAGTAYNLTAEAARDGKRLSGTVQTRVPNPVLTIVLREDAGLPPLGAGPAKPDDKVKDAGGALPPPVPNDPDHIPPMGLAPAQPNPKSSDGAWTPGGAVKGSVPAAIPGSPVPSPAPKSSAGSDPLPEPDDLTVPPAKPVVRPENVADGPRPAWVPPPASIPPVPTPKLPPPPSPPAPKQSRGGGGTNFRLLDSLERPWEFAANRTGSLVLVEFVTTDCPNCRTVVPVLKDVQSRYAADGVEVIAVLCDELPLKERAAAAGKYARASNVNYKVFVEVGAGPGAVRDAFGVESYPRALLLDANGAVLWNGHPGKKTELEAAIRKALGR